MKPGDMVAKKLVDKNLLERLERLEREVRELKTRPVSVTSLDDLSNDLGDMRAGRFLAADETSTGSEPTDADYSGVGMSGTPVEFAEGSFNFFGVMLGALQAGFNYLGQFIFGGGNGGLDASGLWLRAGLAGMNSVKWLAPTGEFVGSIFANGARNAASLLNILATSTGNDASGDAAQIFLTAKSVDTSANPPKLAEISIFANINGGVGTIGLNADTINANGNLKPLTVNGHEPIGSQIIAHAGLASLAAGLTYFLGPGDPTLRTNTAQPRWRTPLAGTRFARLSVDILSAQPATGSLQVMLNVGGADRITLTVAGGSAAGNYVENVTVYTNPSAGTAAVFKIVNNATSASAQIGSVSVAYLE